MLNACSSAVKLHTTTACSSPKCFQDTMVFWKHFGDEQAVVVCNFTAEEQAFSMPNEFEGNATLAVCNRDDGQLEKLKAYEARVYFVRGAAACNPWNGQG